MGIGPALLSSKYPLVRSWPSCSQPAPFPWPISIPMNWTVQLLHPVPVMQSVNILSEGKKVHKTFRLLWVAISAFSDMKVSFQSSLCVHLREGNQPANSPVVLSEALQKLLQMWRGPECTTAAHDTQPATARTRTPQSRQPWAKSVWAPDLYNPITFSPFSMQCRVEILHRCCATAEKNPRLKRTMQNAAKKPPYARVTRTGLSKQPAALRAVCAITPACGWGTLPVLWGRASLEWLSVVFGSLFLKTWGGEANNIPSELRENLQWKLSHCLISIVLSSAEIHERSQIWNDRGTRIVKTWMHRNKTMWQCLFVHRNFYQATSHSTVLHVLSHPCTGSLPLEHSSNDHRRARQLSHYIMVKTLPAIPPCSSPDLTYVTKGSFEDRNVSAE